MNKFRNLILLSAIFLMTFCTSQIVLALNFGDTVKIMGNNKLPNLFYEHNLYNQKTEHDDYIYCIEPNKIGSESSIHEGLIINNLSIFTSQQEAILKSAALNGYPNVILNNFNAKENQCITAMALRCLSMEFKNLTNGRSAEEYINDQKGLPSAKLECKKMIIKAKNLPCKSEYSSMVIKSLSENNIEIPGNTSRVGKAFKLECSNITGPITLNCTSSSIPSLEYPKVILPGEIFYISVPLSKTYEPINFKFQVSAEGKKDIVFIKAINDERQSYVGLILMDKNINSIFDFKLNENISIIKLIKKDIETNEILIDAKFKIWTMKPDNINDDKNLLGTYKSNEQGLIQIDNISKLGTYYYCEVFPPTGYSIKNIAIQSLEVLEYGNVYNKTVYNAQKPLTETFIQLKGYKQVASNQPLKYEVFGAINCSNVKLKNFSIKIAIPMEYANINKKIEIGEFIDASGYRIFYKDDEDNIIEVKKEYNDVPDYLLSSNKEQKTKNILGIFTNDINDNISIPRKDIKEVIIKLIPTANGNEFTTPVFGKGTYSIFVKDNKKEYLLGNNYNGDKENKFKCDDLRSYRIVFNKLVNIDNFTSGEFTSIKLSQSLYSVILETNKRSNISVPNSFRSDESNVINITDLYKNNILNKNEIISNINILFNDEVSPGFKQKNPLYIYGTSNDFKSLCKKYFFDDRKKLYYSCNVIVEGEYKGIIIKNGDEWDTGSFSKELNLNKGYLPKTGTRNILINGLILLSFGNLFIFKWRF